MTNQNIPFQVFELGTIIPTHHSGDTGNALWHTMQLPGLRIRLVKYSAGYLADHWCAKGHIVHCLEGEFISELKDGSQYLLKQGMTYVGSDDLSEHRSSTTTGVKLLIIDGDFLKLKE